MAFTGEDTITEVLNALNNFSEFNGDITLNAKGFDCHNKVMTDDFARTIKANEFPHLSIVFVKLKQTNCKIASISGTIKISGREN